MADNKEWTIGFKNSSFFRISENPYYIKKGKGIGLKEMDYCYLTEDSLDFIECKEVKSISRVQLLHYFYTDFNSTIYGYSPIFVNTRKNSTGRGYLGYNSCKKLRKDGRSAQSGNAISKRTHGHGNGS